MIRVVMFDAGGTLLDAPGHPGVHAMAALDGIAALRGQDHELLATCLVSDYTHCPPPPTAAKVKPLFEQYLALIGPLREAFEPVAKRVTLSTHVGVDKPDRAVFDKALKRLGSKAALAECLLITEDAAHVKAARSALGMQALRFGKDLDDWAQAPALVAQLIGPADADNLLTAAKVFFAARGVDLAELAPTRSAGRWLATGQAWHPVQLPDRSLGTVHMALPVSMTLHRAASGALEAERPAPAASDVEEAQAFAKSLAANGQIATGAAAGPARGATHTLETDADGRRCLVRKRFSAF